MAKTCMFVWQLSNVWSAKLTFYPKEMTRLYSNVIQCHHFALETIMVKNGQTLKKLTFVYKTTTSNEFINYLKPKL
jgi:hypothetical protein